MANIKNKYSSPLSTEFTPKDIVVDIKNGHLYYKSNLGVHKLVGDNSSTNVGIGTTSPDHRLHVVGSNDNTAFSIDIGNSATFDFKANSTSGYVAHFNITDTALYIGHNSSVRDLRFQTNNTDKITIKGGGDVGIGTTTPTEKLTVAGNISASGTIFTDTISSPSNNLVVSSSTVTITTSGSDANLILQADTGNNDEANNPYMTIEQDGGVMRSIIGLTGADSQWPDGGPLLNGKNNHLIIGTSGSEGTAISKRGIQLVTLNTASLTISASGNVGVGTNTPTEKLTVEGNISSSGDIEVGGTISHTVIDTTPTILITGVANSHKHTVYQNTHDDNNQFYARYEPNGGDPPFFEWKHKNGELYPALQFHNNGALDVWGTLTDGVSDARLKENIREIDNALEKIKQIRGVYHDYNSKASEIGFISPQDLKVGKDKNHIGVIAQEVQKVLPQVIRDAPCNSNYLTVDYAKIVPLLIEGIKEQQKQIEDLKIQIEKLK